MRRPLPGNARGPAIRCAEYTLFRAALRGHLHGMCRSMRALYGKQFPVLCGRLPRMRQRAGTNRRSLMPGTGCLLPDKKYKLADNRNKRIAIAILFPFCKICVESKKNGHSGDCSLADRMDRVYERKLKLHLSIKIVCQPPLGRKKRLFGSAIRQSTSACVPISPTPFSHKRSWRRIHTL
jgi:hypothetical protein